ncbi:MAG: hypothetical protein ACOCU6_03425 [Nanoarchaeota archaeon]
MKLKSCLFILLFVLSILAVSCGDYESSTYNHLNNQQLVLDNSSSSRDAESGVYDNLNENLCELKPYCCNHFSGDQMHYREMQLQAIAESDPSLCEVIPEEPLVVEDCPQEEDYIYYNKTYCVQQAGDTR